MEAKKSKRPRCHNCKFSSYVFKVIDMTHHHCENPTLFNQESFDKGEFSAWDTLREFWHTCELHEYKELTLNK